MGDDTAARMGKGQNEGGFSEEQLQMYKDCFKLMDINKDGQLDKNDLRGAFDNVGVLMSESELDGLLGEISGPCTYDNMVKMFQEKMAGEGNDPDDLIVQAFKAYDNEGKIDSKMFEHALKTRGDKMTKAVIGLFVAVKEEPKVEEPLRPSLRRTPTPRRRRRRRRPPSKLAPFSTFLPRLWPTLTSRPTLKTPFQTRYGQYGGGNHPNNIVAWYLTSTNIRRQYCLDDFRPHIVRILFGMWSLQSWPACRPTL